MSWRAIQDDVPSSLTLAALSDGAERLYWRMVSQADPWGRLEIGSPAKLKLICAPAVKWTEAKIAGFLRELQDVDRLQVYEIGGKTYGQIIDWDENQPADVKGRNGSRYRSQHPEPPVLQATPRSAEEHRGTPAESESEKLSGAKAPSSEVEAIYEHWRAVWAKTDPRYNAMSPKRKRAIQARLREFPASDLLRALDGSRKDPWEDRPRHADIAVLFRNQEAVDRWLELADTNGNGPKTKCPECGLPFAGDRTLAQHLANVHGIVMEEA